MSTSKCVDWYLYVAVPYKLQISMLLLSAAGLLCDLYVAGLMAVYMMIAPWTVTVAA